MLVGDADAPRRLAAVLARYSGQWAMAAGELACLGPVDRVLGLAHLAAGRPEQAEALLIAAQDAARRHGATPWVVRSQAGLDDLRASSS